jgi:hypothetical protein
MKADTWGTSKKGREKLFGCTPVFEFPSCAGTEPNSRQAASRLHKNVSAYAIAAQSAKVRGA